MNFSFKKLKFNKITKINLKKMVENAKPEHLVIFVIIIVLLISFSYYYYIKKMNENKEKILKIKDEKSKLKKKISDLEVENEEDEEELENEEKIEDEGGIGFGSSDGGSGITRQIVGGSSGGAYWGEKGARYTHPNIKNRPDYKGYVGEEDEEENIPGLEILSKKQYKIIEFMLTDNDRDILLADTKRKKINEIMKKYEPQGKSIIKKIQDFHNKYYIKTTKKEDFNKNIYKTEMKKLLDEYLNYNKKMYNDNKKILEDYYETVIKIENLPSSLSLQKKPDNTKDIQLIERIKNLVDTRTDEILKKQKIEELKEKE